ncbi:hypothetical protein G6F61_006544 [Rhizopus arrhizus]|nr:hypothetical protein G6F61_006544 [Rhizopus arrhizus]
MTDVKSAPHITSTTLADGVTVHINDHVYLAPEHLGEPYYVGRIMEFCNSYKRKGLQARIAWFNRPKDVINRKSADPCLLVATMHSDINPVSSIRGKCVVTHKYYISKDQLDDYRKQQDHFYYNQLYDRYIQRVYDVVPCETVQNVPMDTLDALKQRYQFIVVEQGKASDLTVARRICCVCQEWCSSAASVKCAACQKSYHMTCLNPPLARKPSKGFAWQCAFCTRQEVLASSSNPDSPVSSNQKTSDKNDAKKRQTRTTRSQISKSQSQTQPQIMTAQPEQQQQQPASVSQPSAIKIKINNPKKVKNSEIKMTNMWPFRYFGVNTNMGDILDIDDRIYPRAKSRIGPKYQANVPDWDATKNRSLSPVSESNSLSSSKSKTKKNDKKGKSVQRLSSSKRSVEPSPSDISSADNYEPFDRSSMAPIRGGDDTVTCIYRPGILNDEQVDDYMDQVKQLNNIPLPSHSSDLMDRALYELEQGQYHTDIAFEKMSQLGPDDFEHIVDWSKKEIELFEQSIREHGHDLNYAKKSVGTKSMADIVRFFYQWKKTDRYEPVYSEWTKIFKPTKKFKKLTQKKKSHHVVKDEVESDEESDPTIVPKATYSERSYQCMNCLTNESDIWRRSPSDIDRKRKVFKQVLCDDCGIYWLKYAKTKPISELTRKVNGQGQISNNTPHTPHGRITMTNITNTVGNAVETLESQKRKRNDSSSKLIVKKIKEEKSEIPLKFEPTECKVCLQFGLEDKLYTCYDCGLSVHSDCYGIESMDKEGWICDPCSNRINPVASYVYECILCCKSSEEIQQPLKKTAGYYWAHVQCAAFIPEIKFVHPKSLSPVEYIGCVNSARLDAVCQLCNSIKGACVACTECKKTVHVQCAIEHKFRLAFEIQSATITSAGGKTKIPIIPAGLFHSSSPSGLMVPQVWCPTHNITTRKLIDLNTRTSTTQESSIMVYAKNYKLIAKGTTPAMRRFRQATYHPYYLYDHHSSKNHHHRHPKVPNAREAALEALTLAEIPSLDQHTTISLPSKSTSLASLPVRVCATDGCSVQHTPIWWSIEEDSDKKICQRCHSLKV